MVWLSLLAESRCMQASSARDNPGAPDRGCRSGYDVVVLPCTGRHHYQRTNPVLPSALVAGKYYAFKVE